MYYRYGVNYSAFITSELETLILSSIIYIQHITIRLVNEIYTLNILSNLYIHKSLLIEEILSLYNHILANIKSSTKFIPFVVNISE